MFEIFTEKKKFLNCPHNVENVFSMNKFLTQSCDGQTLIYMESTFAAKITRKLHINLQNLLIENGYVTYKKRKYQIIDLF